MSAVSNFLPTVRSEHVTNNACNKDLLQIKIITVYKLQIITEKLYT